MSPRNSSTFSSDKARTRFILYLVISTLGSLALLDLIICTLFAYPGNPKATNPTRIQMYFEYGRSTDGQLARMTRRDPSKTAPITLAGWYDPIVAEEPKEPQNLPIITIYGMSHAVQLAHALGRVTHAYTARAVGAPGATANWAYGAYLRDRGGHKSTAVVLALMSANLPMITTMTPMTWNIGFPMPYTADRFYAQEDQLKVVHPPYDSFEGYTRAFQDPLKWAAACATFAKNDTMYDTFIRSASFLDHSSLVRLIRRAYGQRLARNAGRGVLDQSGFNPKSEQVKVARAIVTNFARQARSDGMIPVVYLVNNFGYSNYLYQALEPALAQDKIPFVSSDRVASPSDPRAYLPNSHFVDSVDDRLAQTLISVVEAERQK
jgi:hypothetical protein